MTDPTDQTQAADPLAELEALLAKAKAAKAADPAAGAETAPENQQPPAPDPAEVERQQQQAALENEQMIAAQRAKMAEIGETPQYQARVQNQSEEAAKKEDQRVASDGFEIHQVTTTKIDQ